MAVAVDIDIDWDEEDETGLPWAVLDRATSPASSVPGALVVAGRGAAIAVAEVIDRTDDGIVHLRPMPGCSPTRIFSPPRPDTQAGTGARVAGALLGRWLSAPSSGRAYTRHTLRPLRQVRGESDASLTTG